MRLRFKEDPKEWRKAALFRLVGPAVITSVMRWFGVVSATTLAAVLTLIALAALCACLRPRWFRSFYRFTTRLEFYVMQIMGSIALVAVFFLILTPIGWFMRLSGKDFLQLKSPRDKQTFWQTARPDSSLDDMF